MFTKRIEVCILFATLIAVGGCSSVTKLYKSVFNNANNPATNPANSSENTSPHLSGLCSQNNPAAKHRGIALQLGADGASLLSASGNLPNLQLGNSRLLLAENRINGATDSGPIKNFNLYGDLLNAAQGRFTNKQIFIFAGSPTPPTALDKSQWLSFTGKGHLSLAPSGGQSTDYSGKVTLNFNPATNLADLSVDLDQQAAPFIHLSWTQIAYCDGFFHSTGIGRYRLTAPSGRLTNLVGNSNDGTSGTAILSGLVYGDDSAEVAAFAFAISGVNNTIYALITLPRSQS